MFITHIDIVNGLAYGQIQRVDSVSVSQELYHNLATQDFCDLIVAIIAIPKLSIRIRFYIFFGSLIHIGHCELHC